MKRHGARQARQRHDPDSLIHSTHSLTHSLQLANTKHLPDIFSDDNYYTLTRGSRSRQALTPAAKHALWLQRLTAYNRVHITPV